MSGLWGVGVKVTSQNYVNTKDKVTVAPYIFGSYGLLNIEANRANITLYGNGSVFVSVAGQYRSIEAREDDSAFSERKAAIELGPLVGVILPYDFVLRASYLFDISSAHKGSELDVQLFRHDTWGDFFLLSSFGLQCQSSELSNYYYGTADYDISNAYSAEIEFIGTYTIGNYGVFLGLRNYWYSDEITNSPIVERNNNLQIFSGVGYKF
ncbi:hypothetical protein MNB_SM-4-532 [hydrothermal vent metagenome]|uniref:Outer membrane protein beta-barrel domain-containing protein n=1 Tax=hydrothermal vent metagenome TaxID=652676 RepID=A0A1W1BD03_9ZZZZ